MSRFFPQTLILSNILGSGEDEDLLFDDDDNHEDLIRLMEHDSDLENDDTGSDTGLGKKNGQSYF